MIDGVQAAGGECSNYGVLSTPQLHFFVVCQNTGGAYGKPSEEGYFQKLGQAFLLFGNGVSKIRFTCAINNASENFSRDVEVFTVYYRVSNNFICRMHQMETIVPE